MSHVIIVGGGAAGMMAAIAAAGAGHKVCIYEKNEKLGKKIYITGKGRCNVTNACDTEELFRNVVHNAKFLYSSFYTFTNTDVMDLIEKYGCPLKTERGGRVFPVSDKSSDVIHALTVALRELGVEVELHEEVSGVLAEDGHVSGVRLKRGQKVVPADAVIVTTGGLSYPSTGSTGDGYRFATELGHTITELSPALVPFEAKEAVCKDLQGLSLRNTGVQLRDEKGKTVYQDFGELLFTHFGVSGPTVLSASAHLKPGKSYSLVLDLKPALDEGKLDARFLRDLEAYANRSMENALADLFPHSMIPVLLRRAGIDPALRANSLTRQQRRALLEETKRFVIPISGTRPVEEAIITRGGVSTKEIDPRTMASKLVHGLYFAGELIDCDAYTGGFNLQIAWATAHAAAQVL